MPLSLFLPGYSLNNKLESQEATIIIGWYTFVLHLLSGFYFLDVYRGSFSNSVISPLFEYGGGVMDSLAIILAIYSFVYMFAASLGLIKGVKDETRIYYFPFLFLTAVEIILLYYHAFLLVWRYAYDSNTNVMAVIVLLVTTYHLYLYLIVLSNYRFLKSIQNPTLVFPPDV